MATSRPWQLGNTRNLGYVKPGTEATVRPTTHDITWAAGLFEGEGTVGRNHSGQHGCAFVKVAQKDRWVCDQLRALFGGSIGVNSSYPNVVMNVWQISGSRARGFMMTIYGRLSPRRKEQVRRALNAGR